MPNRVERPPSDGDPVAARLRAAVGDLRQWRRDAERAPHKPLLVLHALGRVVGGQPRLVAFADVEAELAELLEEFGHPRSRQQPRYPFWRLPTDGSGRSKALSVCSSARTATRP